MRLSIPSGNGHVSRYLAFFGRVISVSKLSIVTPAYNESANLPVMYERLVIVLDTIDWEWIIVDDVRNGGSNSIQPNGTGGENTAGDNAIALTATGFTVTSSGSGVNYASGDTMFYWAIAE